MIDLTRMRDNPFDMEGARKIAVGDRVKVIAAMDDNAVQARTLAAESVIRIVNGAAK